MLRSEGVTVLWLTAGLFHLMVEQELEALACVSQVVAGGDVLSAEHVRRLLRAKDGSGAVVQRLWSNRNHDLRVLPSDERARQSWSTGCQSEVRSATRRCTCWAKSWSWWVQGMLGELYIGGAGLARGYYNQPELTAERFVPHPFSTAGGERLYRTGDYVRWRADGTLEFVGRVRHTGEDPRLPIEPGEVEAVLGRHASVSDCAVVTRQEANGEKYLVAYVVGGRPMAMV